MSKSLLNKIAKGIVIASIPVITMFSSSKAIAQTQFQINPFAQPNDTTLAYYGSGDLDSNNVRQFLLQ